MVIDEVIARGIKTKKEPSKSSRRVIDIPLGSGRVIRYKASEQGMYIQNSAENRPSEVILPSTQFPSEEEQEPVSDFYTEGQM